MRPLNLFIPKGAKHAPFGINYMVKSLENSKAIFQACKARQRVKHAVFDYAIQTQTAENGLLRHIRRNTWDQILFKLLYKFAVRSQPRIRLGSLMELMSMSEGVPV